MTKIRNAPLVRALVATAGLVVLAGAAQAENYRVSARVTGVEPFYRTVEAREPVQRCRNVEVPVYGTRRGGSSGDVLAGALIGGAIGNQFGSGSGKDAMTVLGAILGADAAGRQPRQVITGYATERVCETVHQTRAAREVAGYVVSYRWNGLEGQTETTRRYRVGERIDIDVTLR
jgi:uncharacterized protein YcfJ